MKIYKYRTDPEHIKDILSRECFYFADWRDLNDPMEGYFKYYPDKHPPHELKQIVQGKDSFGVSCFSFTYDEILLWTHYAKNHTGVCIEIDTDIECSEEVSFEKVKYESHIPWLNHHTGRQRSPKEILSTKIAKWEFEQEIRAFCTGKNQKFKVGKITKVILGIRVSNDIENIAGNSPDVVQASLDFKTNRITF